MKEDFGTLLSDVGKTADEISLRGWAEANAGNLSVRIDADSFPQKSPANRQWKNIGCALPDIAGDFFLVSAAGAYLKNFQRAPARCLCVIQLDSTGSKFRVIWGCDNGGSPTSELISHLMAQSSKKMVHEGKDKVVIHCHCPNITALGCIENLDTIALTRLLWQTHTECIYFLPAGVEFIPCLLPGSADLAQATAKAFEKRSAAFWQHHGLIAAGPSLEQTLAVIQIIEKNCGIYLQAKAAGKIINKISKQQLLDIAEHFNLNPDKEIFSQI